MRLWSVHPRYLDPKGLVALWREALLAQAVLRGQTRGYRAHPQLVRFAAQADPVAAIGAYLLAVCDEAEARAYAFDRSKIASARPHPPLPVTTGQLDYEWQHLLHKLATRSPALHLRWQSLEQPDCHQLFLPRPGPVENWERPG